MHRTGSKVADLNLRYQTKYHDTELNTYYYGLRHYDPTICRWLSRDPLEEKGGYNLYAFVNNNPVNYIEYLGLALYAFDGTANIETDRTNVFLLHQAYVGINKEYYRGVGNDIDNDPVDGTAGKAIGFKYKKILENAYDDLVKNFKNGDTDIDIIGFSRGGVMAILFAQMIQDRGVPTGEEQLVMGRQGTYKVDIMVQPQINFLGLFDPVPGPRGFPKPQKIPDNVTKTAVAYSLNEMRSAFHPLVLSGNNMVQRGFAGAHSDVGGGYKARGLANITLKWMARKGGPLFNMPSMSNYPELSNKMLPHQEYSVFNVSGVEKKYDFDISRSRYIPKNLPSDPVPRKIRQFYLNFAKRFLK